MKNKRRNRRRNVQMGVLPKLLVRVVILVSLGAVIPLGYWGLDSKCNQVGQEINKSKTLYASLEGAYLHEEARWMENLTTENLDRAILRHGLAMGYPQAHQIVRVDAEGNPLPRQSSIAYLRRANAFEVVAESR